MIAEPQQLWQIAVELDGLMTPREAEKRVADGGWADVVRIAPVRPRDPRLGPLSNRRSPTTMQIEAEVEAPDLDEAVWRLKALLRSLQILRPEPSFLSLAATRVRGGG
jgi:hypothetical protein